MNTQETTNRLQDICHNGSSLSKIYVKINEKLKEIKNVKVIKDLNIDLVVLEVED